MQKILLVFGTRPEAIKMAILTKMLCENKRFNVRVCLTAQHRKMLDQVLDVFEIPIHYDLNVMKPMQKIASSFARIVIELEKTIEDFKPDIVIVHGDTTTSFAASICSFYNQTKIAHVEAGLRTFDKHSPWPEEANRRLTGVLADIHFAPTKLALQNLLNENIPEANILVSGNTVIDALKYIKTKIETNNEIKKTIELNLQKLGIPINNNEEIILVTGHRRENFGKKFDNIVNAIKKIAINNPKTLIVFPVHLNPKVQDVVKNHLSGISNIFLIPPQDYTSFVYLMLKSKLILTDSGGIQEEAPSIQKHVLVMREHTERTEAMDTGFCKLIGTDTDDIVKASQAILNGYNPSSKPHEIQNPYGNGNASQKIMRFLEDYADTV